MRVPHRTARVHLDPPVRWHCQHLRAPAQTQQLTVVLGCTAVLQRDETALALTKMQFGVAHQSADLPVQHLRGIYLPGCASRAHYR